MNEITKLRNYEITSREQAILELIELIVNKITKEES